jgi:hypothetical protein
MGVFEYSGNPLLRRFVCLGENTRPFLSLRAEGVLEADWHAHSAGRVLDERAATGEPGNRIISLPSSRLGVGDFYL